MHDGAEPHHALAVGLVGAVVGEASALVALTVFALAVVRADAYGNWCADRSEDVCAGSLRLLLAVFQRAEGEGDGFVLKSADDERYTCNLLRQLLDDLLYESVAFAVLLRVALAEDEQRMPRTCHGDVEKVEVVHICLYRLVKSLVFIDGVFECVFVGERHGQYGDVAEWSYLWVHPYCRAV